MAEHKTGDKLLWMKADDEIAQFSSLCPQIMLASEILAALRPFHHLVPDLWAITASYATSHDEAKTAGASKILWLRIECLHMSEQSEKVQSLEIHAHPTSSAEYSQWHELGLRLFYAQYFFEARRVFQIVTLGTSGYSGAPTCLLNAILCSIFLGDFEAALNLLGCAFRYPDARDSIRSWHGYGGWSGIVRAVLTTSTPVVPRASLDYILSFGRQCDLFPRTLIENLLGIDKTVAGETKAPAVFEAGPAKWPLNSREWYASLLRKAFHEAALQLTLAHPNMSILEIATSTEPPKLLRSEFIQKDSKRRLRIISAFNVK